MIRFLESPESIQVEQLSRGFFESWPNLPSPETHLRLLRESDAVILALDGSPAKVVGFITAISDGVLAAYIPLLEVVPEYRNRGIGKELVRRMLERLDDLYMVEGPRFAVRRTIALPHRGQTGLSWLSLRF